MGRLRIGYYFVLSLYWRFLNSTNNNDSIMLSKISWYGLTEISWSGNFVETYSFHRVLDEKLCGNWVFPQNFHTKKLGETVTFHVVKYLQNKWIVVKYLEVFLQLRPLYLVCLSLFQPLQPYTYVFTFDYSLNKTSLQPLQRVGLCVNQNLHWILVDKNYIFYI